MEKIDVSKLIRVLLMEVGPKDPLYKTNFILFLNDVFAGSRTGDKITVKFLNDMFIKYDLKALEIHNEKTLNQFDHDNFIVLSARLSAEQVMVLIMDRAKYGKLIDIIKS